MDVDEDRSGEPTAQVDVMAERGALTNLAYRLLGSLSDAEDAVQDAYARWFTLSAEQQAQISSPGAWLNTVVTRVCVDVLRSARVRREQYVGEWLPEPLPDAGEWTKRSTTDSMRDPADWITLDESVDMAFLVVLDSMTPAERVSFLLHDVFRYKFAEVAEIVGRSPGACRQLASTARARIRHSRGEAVPPDRRAAIVSDLRRAWQAKDVEALIQLLDPSVSAVADGGGRVPASRVAIVGAPEVAAYLLRVTEQVPNLELLERRVNGQPGLVAVAGSELLAVFAYEITGDRVRRVWAIRNPDKLRPWNRL